MSEPIDLPDEIGDILYQFEVGDLNVDWDPALVCRVVLSTDDTDDEEERTCDTVVCTIERGDTFRVLAATALDHYRGVHCG